LNFPLFIAKRISFSGDNKKKLSGSVLKIAVGVVAVGMAVMVITVSVVTGFKKEIYLKIIGFQSHITIKNRDINETFESAPIRKNQIFYPGITKNKGIKHIQIFSTKPGIIKGKEEVLGVILKGVGSDYQRDFLEKHIIEGKFPNVLGNKETNEILISRKTADLLNYKLNDKIDIFFIQDPPKARRFVISGIYKTGMEETDKAFAFCDIRHINNVNDWDDDQISGFEILIDDMDNLDRLTKLVEDEVSGIITDNGSMFQVSNFKRDNEFIVQWLKLSDTNVVVILTLMIIVALLSMIAALLVIILERTNMIGILKAAGADNSKIIKIFIYNGSYLILKGMIIGNIIGFILLYLEQKFKLIPLDPASYYVDSVPVEFNFVNILILNVGTLLVSTAVLLIPALLVAKIDPSKTVNFK
jgi:lipoprotein-releasing system permease protein